MLAVVDDVVSRIEELEIERVKCLFWRALAGTVCQKYRADPAAEISLLKEALDSMRDEISAGDNGARIQEAWIEFQNEARNLLR